MSDNRPDVAAARRKCVRIMSMIGRAASEARKLTDAEAVALAATWTDGGFDKQAALNQWEVSRMRITSAAAG